MPPFRMQFSLREISVVIAVIALNLAAGMTSRRWYPPEGWDQAGDGEGMANAFCLRDEAGLIFWYFDYFRSFNGQTGPVGEIQDVIRCVFTTPTQALSPSVASISLTLLILAVLWVRGSLSRKVGSAAPHEDPKPKTSRLALIAGSIVIAASLVGLNRAAAVYRPPSEPFDIKFTEPWSSADPGRVDMEDLFGGCPKTVVVRVDGRAAVSHHVDGSDIPSIARGVTRQQPLPGRPYTLESATIECGIDDSVVAYGGTYDHKLSKPKVIRPASRSWFDIWWLPVGSALVTVYVVLDLGWLLLAHFRAATARGRIEQEGRNGLS